MEPLAPQGVSFDDKYNFLSRLGTDDDPLVQSGILGGGRAGRAMASTPMMPTVGENPPQSDIISDVANSGAAQVVGDVLGPTGGAVAPGMPSRQDMSPELQNSEESAANLVGAVGALPVGEIGQAARMVGRVAKETAAAHDIGLLGPSLRGAADEGDVTLGAGISPQKKPSRATPPPAGGTGDPYADLYDKYEQAAEADRPAIVAEAKSTLDPKVFGYWQKAVQDLPVLEGAVPSPGSGGTIPMGDELNVQPPVPGGDAYQSLVDKGINAAPNQMAAVAKEAKATLSPEDYDAWNDEVREGRRNAKLQATAAGHRARLAEQRNMTPDEVQQMQQDIQQNIVKRQDMGSTAPPAAQQEAQRVQAQVPSASVTADDTGAIVIAPKQETLTQGPGEVAPEDNPAAGAAANAKATAGGARPAPVRPLTPNSEDFINSLPPDQQDRYRKYLQTQTGKQQETLVARWNKTGRPPVSTTGEPETPATGAATGMEGEPPTGGEEPPSIKPIESTVWNPPELEPNPIGEPPPGNPDFEPVGYKQPRRPGEGIRAEMANESAGGDAGAPPNSPGGSGPGGSFNNDDASGAAKATGKVHEWFEEQKAAGKVSTRVANGFDDAWNRLKNGIAPAKNAGPEVFNIFDRWSGLMHQIEADGLIKHQGGMDAQDILNWQKQAKDDAMSWLMNELKDKGYIKNADGTAAETFKIKNADQLSTKLPEVVEKGKAPRGPERAQSGPTAGKSFNEAKPIEAEQPEAPEGWRSLRLAGYSGLMAPEAVASAIHNIIDPAYGRYWGILFKTLGSIKESQLALSGFHAGTLSAQLVRAGFAAGKPGQGFSNLGTAVHAMIDPRFFREWVNEKGGASMLHSGAGAGGTLMGGEKLTPEARGLGATNGDDIWNALFSRGVGATYGGVTGAGAGYISAKAQGLNEEDTAHNVFAGATVGALGGAVGAKMFSNALWGRFVPVAKATTWNMLKESMGEREAAKHVNNVFGGQNLLAIARSPRFQEGLRLMFLAPDWIESWMNVARNFVGGPIGQRSRAISNQSRLYAVALAAGAMLTTQAINMALNDGKTTFQTNDPAHWFMANIDKGVDTMPGGFNRTYSDEHGTGEHHYYLDPTMSGPVASFVRDMVTDKPGYALTSHAGVLPGAALQAQANYIPNRGQIVPQGTNWRQSAFPELTALAARFAPIGLQSAMEPNQPAPLAGLATATGMRVTHGHAAGPANELEASLGKSITQIKPNEPTNLTLPTGRSFGEVTFDQNESKQINLRVESMIRQELQNPQTKALYDKLPPGDGSEGIVMNYRARPPRPIPTNRDGLISIINRAAENKAKLEVAQGWDSATLQARQAQAATIRQQNLGNRAQQESQRLGVQPQITPIPAGVR